MAREFSEFMKIIVGRSTKLPLTVFDKSLSIEFLCKNATLKFVLIDKKWAGLGE